MSGQNDSQFDSQLRPVSLRRRAVIGALAAGTGLAALGGTGVADQHEQTGTGAIDPVFGFPARSTDVDPPVEPDHEVTLREDARQQEVAPFPEWHFEPAGLYVEPGDTVRFQLQTHFHTVTAYHPEMGYTQRVPDGVGPISSPVLWEGAYFLYTFEEPGVYDLLCLPHEWTGMVIRVVVGEPTGPGAEEVPEPQFSEEFPNPNAPLPPDWLAATVLQDPALDPENIVEQGSVAWDDIDPESKAFPEELLAPPTGGESLVAALSDHREGVESDASGCAHFTPVEGGLAWDLVVEDIRNATQAHVHEGARGERGPVVAPMVEYTAEVDGEGQGEPRSADPDAPLIEGGVIDDPDLVEAILEDPSGYYVNVHTLGNPGGEIRGQIRSRGLLEDEEAEPKGEPPEETPEAADGTEETPEETTEEPGTPEPPEETPEDTPTPADGNETATNGGNEAVGGNETGSGTGY